MKTTIEELNDRFLVTLEGELDTVAAVEVNERLQPLYQANGKNVDIDCKDLEYIASSGLRILVSLVNGATAGGSKVVLHHVNENIKDVFQMTGFTSLFEIED